MSRNRRLRAERIERAKLESIARSLTAPCELSEEGPSFGSKFDCGSTVANFFAPTLSDIYTFT